MKLSDPLYTFMDGYDKANPSENSWWPVLENAVKLYNKSRKTSHDVICSVHEYLVLRSV